MNKKLLTVAIGAALSAAPMLAQAQVKVGGHAQVEYYSAEATCAAPGGGYRFSLVAAFAGRPSSAPPPSSPAPPSSHARAPV